MKRIITTTLTLALLILQHFAVSNNIYVSTSGNDQNPCTVTSPCRSITHGIAIALAGDVVNVAAGTYNENVTVNKTITLQANGSVIIDGSNLSIQSGGGIIVIPAGVTGATVKGFDIQNAKQYGIGVFGDNSTISGNKIHNTVDAGLWIRYAKNSNFLDNEIYKTVQKNASGTVCSPTATAWPSAINSWDTASFNTFRGNFVHDNCGEGIVLHSNDIVQNNTFKNNWSVEIYLASVQSTLVDGNTIIDDKPYIIRGSDQSWRAVPAGIAIADEAGCTASDNLITNNTITGSRYGFSFYDYSGGTCSGIKNTTISNNTVIGAREYGFRLLNGTHVNSKITGNIINLTGAIARPLTIQTGGFLITGNYFKADTVIFEYIGKSYSSFAAFSAVVPGNYWGSPTTILTDTPLPATTLPSVVPSTITSTPAPVITVTRTPTQTSNPPTSTFTPTLTVSASPTFFVSVNGTQVPCSKPCNITVP